MVRTKKQVLSAIQGHAVRLREYGVRRCGVFGSLAREHSTPQSDVDVLVEFEAGKKPSTISFTLLFSSRKSWEGP